MIVTRSFHYIHAHEYLNNQLNFVFREFFCGRDFVIINEIKPNAKYKLMFILFFFFNFKRYFYRDFYDLFDICYFQVNKLYFGFIKHFVLFSVEFSRVPLCPGIPQRSEFRANFLITVLSQYTKYIVMLRKNAFSIIVNFIVTWSGVLLSGRCFI